MAIAARVEDKRLVVEFDPQGGEGIELLFHAITRVAGDYAATLGAASEVSVAFGRPDSERKIFAWLQGVLSSGKAVIVRPMSPEAHDTLRAVENTGIKPWTALQQPAAQAAPAKRATRPLMRPTRKVEKPPIT